MSKEVSEMPRPRKCRKVCQLPRTLEFVPANGWDEEDVIFLTVDEYEAIRLIDKQGFSQEECSTYMKVSRATVQMIYNSARKKLAQALVDALPLRIQGGDYQLCDGEEEFCDCGGCKKHRPQCAQVEKEDGKMRVAIPLDENKQDVCIVLARAPYFLFHEDGKDTVVENPAAAAEGGAGIQVAQFLVDNQVDVLITVRCGQNAADVFKAADMKIYKSVNKAAADDIAAWKAGSLEELTQFHAGFHGVQ